MTERSHSGYRTASILAFLLSATMQVANAQQTKVPDEAGTVTYHAIIGKTAMGGNIVENLKIGPPHGGMSRITIDVGSPGCAGTTSGMASVQGNTLLLTKDSSGNECGLTIRRTASGATVKEDNCMIEHGASCDFNSGKPLRRVR
jgi:hypothetical protein